jgi:hypothetical protein
VEENLFRFVLLFIILTNNDEGRAIYGNLENKINTLYRPVENSIPKNNDRSLKIGDIGI